MDKERLEKIGRFLNDRMIIHRNVENNSHWTTEEKMIQELYDNYLDLLLKSKKQKEVIDKAIKYNKELSEMYDIGSMERSNADTNLLILGDIKTIDILKEVSK